MTVPFNAEFPVLEPPHATLEMTGCGSDATDSPGATWPLRWMGGLRRVRQGPAAAENAYGDGGALAGMEPGTPVGQPKKRRRAAPSADRVPVKPPVESAAARTGPALQVRGQASKRQLLTCS